MGGEEEKEKIEKRKVQSFGRSGQLKSSGGGVTDLGEEKGKRPGQTAENSGKRTVFKRNGAIARPKKKTGRGRQKTGAQTRYGFS